MRNWWLKKLDRFGKSAWIIDADQIEIDKRECQDRAGEGKRGKRSKSKVHRESAFELLNEPFFESEKVPASPAGLGISMP